MPATAALAAAVCASLIANAALLYLLHRFAVIDVPNARSLHAQPTPRGGGIAIALVFSVGVAFLSTTGAWHWPWLLIGAGFAALGGWDDWRPRRTAVRLGAQIALSAVFLVLTWPGTLTLLSALQFTLIALAFVWMVNLFNFMDGADGFAAAQTILFTLGAAWIFAHHGHAELAYALLTLAAVTAGFLPYNWHPARMFMGDVGSYFLGFQFAAFLYAGWRFEASPAALLILAAPFVSDATLTLLRRMFSGQAWWSAHRTHVYQRLVLRGWSPRQLVGALVVLNCVWCWPAAWYATRQAQHEWLVCALVYGVLSGLWYHCARRSRCTG